jgi:hypothetical protein
MRHRHHLDCSIVDPKPHGTAEIASYRFTNQRYAMGIQYLPCCHQVPLAHLNGSGWSKACEHAGTAGEACGDSLGLRAIRYHQLYQAGNRGLGKLCGIAV